MENTLVPAKKSAGRPRTGRSTQSISLRLPIEVLEVYRLRSEKDGYASVNAYIVEHLSNDALRNRHPRRKRHTAP